MSHSRKKDGPKKTLGKVKLKQKKLSNRTKKVCPAKRLRRLATEAVMFNCECGNMCLAKCAGENAGIQASREVLEEYMKPWLSYRRGSDHRGEFLKLLEGCTTGFSQGGERQGDLVLHLHHVNYKVHKVCRTAFAKAHLRGHDYYDKVLLSCKQRSTLSKNYRLSKTSERTKSMETSPIGKTRRLIQL